MVWSLSNIKDITDAAKSIITTFAIIVGGFWTYWLFVSKRQKYPRAKLEHKISSKLITIKNKRLLSIDVVISNIGDVLLSLETGEISVSQMLPPQTELLGILNGDRGVEVTGWQAVVPSQRTTWKKDEIEIEPGESQQIPYHFVIDSNIESVLVYTYFRNVRKRGHIIGWDLTTAYHMKEVLLMAQQMPHPSLQIDPQFGRIGSIFRFKATHFDPGTSIRASILAPDGSYIYDGTLITDDNGNLGYGELERQAESRWTRGEYRFIVTGKCYDKKVTTEEVFHLLEVSPSPSP